MPDKISDTILQLLKYHSPITAQQITQSLRVDFKISIKKEEVNSILYGALHEFVIRDKDERGYPVWRVKNHGFEAAKGLEVMFYNDLIKHDVITSDSSLLDYSIENIRNKKTYYLDIAIMIDGAKFNIEIDGFEHIRADARLSIQKQLEQNGRRDEIIIDWMDNETSYADFGLIDNKRIFSWLARNRSWCVRYHDELLKPHDITRNIWLIENGWRVIRFWNFEIKDELKRCREIVKAWISK
jgi:very-short-patch-repair endonuclease